MRVITIILIFSGYILSYGCKKENDHAQWDVELIGPLLHASLSVNELVADTIRQIASDGTVSLLIEKSFYDLRPDSIYHIPDTSISNIVVWPIFSTPIQPNSPFYSNDNVISLGITSVLLSKSLLRSGILHISLQNSLPTKVIYTYTIPKAKKNGQAFSIVQEVEAKDATGPGIYTGDFDLSGYEIDLSGVNGNQFNTLTYNVNAISDPNGVAFTINMNDTVINLNSSLIDLEPIYVKGYLGQTTISEKSFFSTGLSDIIYGGLIDLDSIVMDLDVVNSIGADARIYFNSLQSINDRTGTVIPLIAPSLLNQPLNINRAQESGPAPSPVISSNHSYRLDNSNSNVKAFIENLPERISYDVDLSLNPLGNISFYNDFLYSDFLIDGNLKIQMPLRFAAENLTLADTQDLSLGGLTNLDPFGPLSLTLVANNGFPLNFDLQLFILDENHQVTDSLLVPGLIRSALLDFNYKVIAPEMTRIEIPIDSQRKDHILNSKFMGIRAGLLTPDYPQHIQLYDTYRLDLQLIANGTYYIR